MSEFYADPAVGGDGSRTTDDDNPTTGLANGGFWTRLVPMFKNVMQMANYVRERASVIAQQSQTASNAAVTAVAAANTATAKAAFQDTAVVVQNATDPTRQVRISASQVPTGSTVVLSVPAVGGTLATTALVDQRIADNMNVQSQRQKRHATGLTF